MPFPPYNPRMREFVRQDANNNDVAGTNISRKKKPKVGKWREITPWNECCFPSTDLTYTPPDVSLDGITLTIACDAASVLVVSFAAVSTDIDSLVSLLNTNLSYLGVFTVDDSDIDFKLRQEIADGLCAEGELTFTVTETA
jgi:hypothetical protein